MFGTKFVGVSALKHYQTEPTRSKKLKRWSMYLATPNQFTGMSVKLKNKYINYYNRLKNPNWREADQLAIYKHDRGVELGSTEKQRQLQWWSEWDLNPRPLDFKSAP